jgi:O-antigen/teichoic acid export membrane protein
LQGFFRRLISPGLTHAVLFRGSFIGASGIIAQAIPFLAAPVFTRLYDTSAFALYAIIATLVGCIGGAAPMKFDVAIPISKTPDEARSLWQISTMATFVVLCALLLIGRGSPDWLAHINISPTGGTWPLVLAASGIAAGFQSSNAWLLYADSYIAISIIRLVRGLSFVGFALIFFDQNLVFLDHSIGNRGLLFAFLVGTLVGAIVSFLVALVRGLRPFKVERIGQVLMRYRDFPLKAAIPALLDLVALAAPLVAISRLYTLNDAAMFGLFRQAITAPLSLISSAFGQVLTRQLAELIAFKQRVRRLVWNTFLALCGLSIVLAITVFLEGPEIFRIVYGTKWPEAGNIAVILVIPAVCQFVASALSGALVALRHLTLLACWQIAYFVAIFSLIFVEPQSMTQFLFGLATIDVVLSLAYLIVIARAISLYERSECAALARAT